MKDTSITAVSHIQGFPWDKLFPDILWIAFWLLLLFLTRSYLKTLIQGILNRFKHGVGVKIGSFELQGLKVTAGSEVQNNHFTVTKVGNEEMDNFRNELYANTRGAMLVHKIFKSQKDGQLYDLLFYIIPHKGCNLIQLSSVDYYFGKYWGSKIFSTSGRSNGFAIATSAYGSFLCVAKLNFNDGKHFMVYRYIDFEMGDVAAMTMQKDIKKA